MKNFLAGTLLVLSTLPAMAAPTAYECKYEGHTGRNGLQKKAVYVIDPEAGTAMAYDGLIHHTHKAPLPTSYKELQPGKYLLKWQLDNIPSKRGNISLTATFSARVNTGNRSSTISVRMHGADNDIRGSGRCTVLRQ
jgi:hypothetical protein